VTGTVSDPSYPPYSGVESVTVNGVAATVDGNSFTAEGVVLHQGENTITSVAKDMAGNTSTHSITVTYDPDITASYSYTYDNNGNLSAMTKHVDGSPPPPDETTQYEYDYENRMTKVILPNSTTNEFSYDGDKRRVSAKNAAGQVTRFLYDGINNLKDYNEDWEPLASYVQGIGIDKLISRKDADGVRYYHADALGSTRLMTDSTQSTTAAYQYDAWGKITSQSGGAGNRHKFTGREWEDEIKLQYNRARFYDPETGRFITQDPLTKGPDDPSISYRNNIYAIVDRVIQEYMNSFEPYRILNRYAYCANNPINYIDPLGLLAEGFTGFNTNPDDPESGIKQIDQKLDCVEVDSRVHSYKEVTTKEGLDRVVDEIFKAVDRDSDGKISDKENEDVPVEIYGHSYGAWAADKVATELEKKGIEVDFQGTIDYANYANWWSSPNEVREVGSNVERAINARQEVAWPEGARFDDKGTGRLDEYLVDKNHASIDNDAKVQADFLREIGKAEGKSEELEPLVSQLESKASVVSLK